MPAEARPRQGRRAARGASASAAPAPAPAAPRAPGAAKASSLLAVVLSLAACPVLCSGRCDHEEFGAEAPDPADGQVDGDHIVLEDGRPISSSVGLNMTKRFFYTTNNMTTMNQPDRFRKMIVSLEPCEGVVYLLVRKTRRCWPNPYSCCQPRPGSGGNVTAPPCNTDTHVARCDWTHFNSILDGTRDAAPTFFEVPHNSVSYYISVFAPTEANLQHSVRRPSFRLTVLADIGAFPRPGRQGRLSSSIAGERALEVTWDVAAFVPAGISDLKTYHLYSSLLLPSDRKENEAVFISPAKVMNSVCGLEHNAVRYGLPIGPESCHQGVCKAVIKGVVPKRRYMLNVVAESHRGFNSTYAGIIVSSDWADSRSAMDDWSERTTSLVGSICGTVFGILVMGYLWIVKLYK